MKKEILILILILGLANMTYAANCGGAIQCNCGDTLMEDQLMWYDIIGCEDSGLWIGDDSITLDCGNHTIEGNYSNNAKGIFNINNDDITIKNCEVKGFDYGIYTGSSLNSNVHNNIVRNNENGIWLQYLEGSFIHNNLVDSNDIYGIFLSQSNDNDVYMNQISSNAYGIRLYQVDTHHFFDNELFENGRGIQIDDGDYNWFYGNTFVGNLVFNALEFPGVDTTRWNNSLTGNFWDDFESNEGYPNYYVVDGEGLGIDYMPIWTFNIPDPEFSYVELSGDGGLLTCPAGDTSNYEYLVVGLRDLNNEPLSGISASEFEFSVDYTGDSYETVSFEFIPETNMTNENGELRFSISADSTLIGNAEISVSAMAVNLIENVDLDVKSFDLNYDGSVSIADLGMFASEYNTNSSNSDFDWRGFVNIVDLGMFAAHYGHSDGKEITHKLPKGLLNKF